MKSPCLVVLLLLAACGSIAKEASEAPAWTQGDPYVHPDCRRPLELAAVGSSPGLGPAAEDRARLDAIGRMSGEIYTVASAELVQIGYDRLGSSGSEWKEEVDRRVRVETSSDFLGAAIRDRYQDKARGQTIVLVSVSREGLLDQLLQPVEQALAGADAYLAGLTAAGQDPARTLVGALAAHAAVERNFLAALKATAVARGSPWEGRAAAAYRASIALLETTQATVAARAASMRLRKTAGDAQAGSPRGQLAEPLEATFTYADGARGEQPLADLPVRFRAAGAQPGSAAAGGSGGDGRAAGRLAGPALVPLATATDADGRIRCRVTDLAATAPAMGQVVVEVDLGGGAALLADLLPSDTFVYSLPTSGQTSVAVGIEARFDGAVLPDDALQVEVADYLSSAGFRSQVVRGLVDVSPTELARKHGDRFQYAVRGEVSATYRSQAASGHWFGARAHLDVIDLSTGTVLKTIAPPEKRVLHPDTSAAGARAAISKLRGDLLAALDEQFVALFAP